MNYEKKLYFAIISSGFEFPKKTKNNLKSIVKISSLFIIHHIKNIKSSSFCGNGMSSSSLR